jgi:hypothetical protein
MQFISAGYPRTMGIALRAGRALTDQEIAFADGALDCGHLREYKFAMGLGPGWPPA